ncbi:MAG: hypothetical protein IPH62_03480 [Ignavibacteriae bacterium]|nr:hypothetical protein [Ignavibacteriota bacterium]
MNYLLKLLLFLLLFTFGCEIPNEYLNKKFQYSLIFNLTVNQENQEFYIYRLVDDELEFESGSPDRYFERSANILLNNDELSFNSFIVKKIPNNSIFSRTLSYTNSNELILKPSTNYKINVSVNDIIITGNTKTPADFNIISPANNSTIKLTDLQNEGSIIIKWQKSLTAKGYIGQISQHFYREWQDTTYEALENFEFIIQDTTFIYTDFINSTGTMEINIFAYDENYHNHFIEKIEPTGVEGGYGYFVSSVKKSIKINIE